MAADFVKQLDDLVTASNGDWRKFIRTLGPVHAAWHTEHNAGTATLGFLLFHWELVARFKTVGADHGLGGLGGIVSYTEAQLANYNASYTVTEHSSAGDISSFEVFSGDLEAWHNDAHMEIGMAVHQWSRDLVIPRQWR